MSKRGLNSTSDIEKEDDLMFDVNDDNDSLSSTIELSQHTLVSTNVANMTNNQMTVESNNATQTTGEATATNALNKSFDGGQARYAMRKSGAKISTSMSDIDPDEDILKNLLKKN